VLLEGIRILEDTINVGSSHPCLLQEPVVESIAFADRALEGGAGRRVRDLLGRLDSGKVIRVDSSLMRLLSDVKTPPMLVAAVQRPRWRLPAQPRLVLVLDGLRDPGNVGTLIRSARAFNIDWIECLPNTADPWSQKCLRAAMGATFHLPIVMSDGWKTHTLVKHRERDLRLFAADASATGDADERGEAERQPIVCYQADLTQPSSIIVGGEPHGLSEPVRESIHDGSIQPLYVPMAAHTADSLNAGVAGSILMAERFRQMHYGY